MLTYASHTYTHHTYHIAHIPDINTYIPHMLEHTYTTPHTLVVHINTYYTHMHHAHTQTDTHVKKIT